MSEARPEVCAQCGKEDPSMLTGWCGTGKKIGQSVSYPNVSEKVISTQYVLARTLTYPFCRRCAESRFSRHRLIAQTARWLCIGCAAIALSTAAIQGLWLRDARLSDALAGVLAAGLFGCGILAIAFACVWLFFSGDLKQKCDELAIREAKRQGLKADIFWTKNEFETQSSASK